MEKWEKRLEHDRAIRNIQCGIRNIPIPTDENGTLKNVPNLFQIFKGQEFWSKMNKAGHTSMSFETCNCRVK